MTRPWQEIRKEIIANPHTRNWRSTPNHTHERRIDYLTMIDCSVMMFQVRHGLATPRSAAEEMRMRKVSIESALRMLAVKREH